MRVKSPKLVMSSGVPPTGPRRVGPTKPVVVVLTPSIDLPRKLTSSTYTPGARYSATGPSLGECHGSVHHKLIPSDTGVSRRDASLVSTEMVLSVALRASSDSGSGGGASAGS